jgi:hypothetical protein
MTPVGLCNHFIGNEFAILGLRLLPSGDTGCIVQTDAGPADEGPFDASRREHDRCHRFLVRIGKLTHLGARFFEQLDLAISTRLPLLMRASDQPHMVFLPTTSV